MHASAAAAVLGSVDLLSNILGFPDQAGTMARCVSKTVSRSVRTAAHYVFSPRALLRGFFDSERLDSVYSLLRDRGAIFTGSGVMRFLGGKEAQSLVLLVPEDAFEIAVGLIRAHGYHRFFKISSDAIYNAGHDSSEEVEYAPYTRQVCLWHETRSIWVCVPRHNVLYGVLHQRTTLFMNGLCADGFFSLYPAAAFTAHAGLVTRGPTASRWLGRRTPIPYTDFALKGHSSYVEGMSPFHRPYRSGRRFFGDGMCWLLPHSYIHHDPTFKKLEGNGWALANHWRLGQKMICTRIVRSRLLRETYLASAVCKAFVCSFLAAVEVHAEPSYRLDEQMPRLIRAFEAKERIYISVAGAVHCFSV